MKRLFTGLAAVALVAILAPAASAATTYETRLGSVRVSGGPPNGISYHAQFSAGGSDLTFYSYAKNVTADVDTNGTYDVFVRDLDAGGHATERVSESTSGEGGEDASVEPRISGDGRYVAWHSESENLVTGDHNGNDDVFLRDTVADTTTVVSVTETGGFPSGSSTYASLSNDGRYIAFQSTSSLAPGEGGGYYDIFVRDVQAGITERISARSSSSSHARISGNGRYVVYESDDDGDAQIFRYDRQTDTTLQLTSGNGDSSWPVADDAGDTIAFPSGASDLVAGDTNGVSDVFVYEVATGAITQASVSSSEVRGNKRSANSFGQTISPDGYYVTFNSRANKLVPNDTNDTWDVFVRDLRAGTTRRASVSSAGVEGNDQSNYPSVTSGGLTVGFQSDATNLILNDRDRGQDIFLNEASG